MPESPVGRTGVSLNDAQGAALEEFERLLATTTDGLYRLDLNEADPPTYEVRIYGSGFGFVRLNPDGSVVLI
jgi:hypothetical protein